MSTTPTIKVTLAHTSGAVSSYKPNTGNNADVHGGLREAIVTCFSRFGDADKFQRVDLLRADIPGASWAAMDRAGAFPEMQSRLEKAAHDLADGHVPHVVVVLAEGRGMTDAHMVTNSDILAAELKDPAKRSLAIPRVLPFQMGGSELGSTAVIYSPAAGGGLRLHSIHPTEAEARIAEADLQGRGETKTGQLQVQTDVTKLLALVAAGDYKPATPEAAVQLPKNAPTAAGPSTHPGLMPSMLAAPTPFDAHK